MVEVVTRDVTSSTFLVSGLSQVQCGFSFPVPNALHQYDVAMEAAVAAHCGVLEIGPSMAAQEAMPWSLKEVFLSGQSAVAIAGCLITAHSSSTRVTCPYTPASFDPAPMPQFLVGRIYAILPLGNPHQRHHLQTMSCPLRDEAVS